MKYAAGCFGCLTFLFLGLSVVLSFGMGTILTQLPPEAAAAFSGLAAPIQWTSQGCCCMSGVLAIVLFAVGSMGKKEESYE